MTKRNYSNTATEAVLLTFIDATALTFTLANYGGFPATPFTAVIDRGTADEEVVLVTGVVGTTVSVSRAYDSTTAKSHQAGAKFLHVTVAKDYDEAGAHTNASSGVHGIAGSVVGTSDAQTLTNKTLTAPTLTSATLTGTTTTQAVSATTLSTSGAATLASLTVSGASSLAALTVSGAAAFSAAVTVQAPTLAAHPARKSETDALDTRLTAAEGTLTAAASTETNNALAKRDASGNIAFGTVTLNDTTTGAAVSAAARKDYVDAGDTANTNALKHPYALLNFATGTQSLPNNSAGPANVITGTADASAEFSSEFTYNSGTGAVTCSKAGLYRVGGTVGFAANATGRRYAQVFRNGTAIPQLTTLDANITAVTWTLGTPSVLVRLAAGDTLALAAQQDSGAALNANKDFCNLSIDYVAP